MNRLKMTVVILTGGLAVLIAALGLAYTVTHRGITPEENGALYCELTAVVHASVLDALARELATAKTEDDRLTVLSFFDTTIRRLEALPCDFKERPS